MRSIIFSISLNVRSYFQNVDDRVRAVSMAMGMIPVIWTRSPSGNTFDTNGMEDFHTILTRLTTLYW